MNEIVNGNHTKLIKDVRQRMTRLESRVTSFMRYNGFRPGVDLEVDRTDNVFLDTKRGELHATSPDVPVGMILDAAVDTRRPTLALYVSGARCGTIEIPQPTSKTEGDSNDG